MPTIIRAKHNESTGETKWNSAEDNILFSQLYQERKRLFDAEYEQWLEKADLIEAQEGIEAAQHWYDAQHKADHKRIRHQVNFLSPKADSNQYRDVEFVFLDLRNEQADCTATPEAWERLWVVEDAPPRQTDRIALMGDG